MKCLLSWLLLSSLCSLSSWGSTGFLVTQSPHELTVKEGDSVQIQCCWNQNFTQGAVNWLDQRNETLASNNNTRFQSKIFNNHRCQGQPQGSVACNCSNLTLSYTTVNHSGLYTCKVSIEIPGLLQYYGNGTKITVTARTFDDTSKDAVEPGIPLPHITVPLAVLALFVTALLCLLGLWRTQLGGSGRAARVIYEAPRPEAEGPGNTELIWDQEEGSDSLSTASSPGSRQWCEVKVYESFDYFAVENKDDS